MKRAWPLPAAFILATLTACSRDAGPRVTTNRDPGTPSSVATGSSDSKAPRGAPLVFPSSKLKSAEVQSWRVGGDWKPVDLETASELVSALSENHRYFKPENVICALLSDPKWKFRFCWSDGTSVLFSLTAGGEMIHGSEKEHDGVREDIDYGTYVVESKRVKMILERCPSVQEFAEVKCAICGVSVLENTPYSKGRGARIFFFCGQGHLDRFEQSPETYETDPKSSQGEEHR